MVYIVNWLTEGSEKPDRRFIKEVIYGVQASKNVKLSNIFKVVGGEDIPLIKTETRLSRNIGKADLSDGINSRLIEGLKGEFEALHLNSL